MECAGPSAGTQEEQQGCWGDALLWGVRLCPRIPQAPPPAHTLTCLGLGPETRRSPSLLCCPRIVDACWCLSMVTAP